MSRIGLAGIVVLLHRRLTPVVAGSRQPPQGRPPPGPRTAITKHTTVLICRSSARLLATTWWWAYTGQGVQQVELNGLQDTFGNIGTGRGKYPFWTVEYLYTYGAPALGSLTEKFLSYMGTGTVKELLRVEGYTPCVDGSQNLMSTLCAPGAR